MVQSDVHAVPPPRKRVCRDDGCRHVDADAVSVVARGRDLVQLRSSREWCQRHLHTTSLSVLCTAKARWSCIIEPTPSSWSPS